MADELTDERQSNEPVDEKKTGGLTDEQIAAEEEFLKGIPRFNLGAFVMPAIWGPAHGFWVAILYYPIWLLADNVLYNAYEQQTAFAIVIAVLVILILIAITLAFALVSQPLAAHKAVDKGKTKEQYVARERIWTVVCVVIGIVFIAIATWYNLDVRPTL